jgi:hypothetical protein
MNFSSNLNGVNLAAWLPLLFQGKPPSSQLTPTMNDPKRKKARWNVFQGLMSGG